VEAWRGRRRDNGVSDTPVLINDDRDQLTKRRSIIDVATIDNGEGDRAVVDGEAVVVVWYCVPW